jgi:hypothetical protein
MFHEDRKGRVDQGVKLILGERASIGLMHSFSRVAKEREDAGKNNNKMLPGYCCLDTPFESGNISAGIKVRCIIITSELDLTLASRSSANKCDAAREYLEGISTVVDDCAATSNLSVDIVRDEMFGTCERTRFIATPVHSNGECGDSIGDSLIFLVRVDGSAPRLSCSLGICRNHLSTRLERFLRLPLDLAQA